MKINEAEVCVGITKKNIRFYEDEGLLTPRRNTENGYREYSEADVQTLKRIKLFRKLGFPLDEIRRMQNGVLSVTDGMERHRIALERDKKNIEQSILLCEELSQQATKPEDLNADSILSKMDALESGGTMFQNKYEKDRKKNVLASVCISIVIILAIVGINASVVWAAFYSDEISIVAVPLVMAASLGVGWALFTVLAMRLKEITVGEIEKAKRY